IQLNGNGLSTPVLTLVAGYSTVRYLAIYNYTGIGINDGGTGILVTSDNNLIEASYIGLDSRGVLGSSGQYRGVAIHPPDGRSAINTVIRNSVISGNYQNLVLAGSAVRNGQVISNFIGTTVDGTKALVSLDT